jgi:hypothetical protein
MSVITTSGSCFAHSVEQSVEVAAGSHDVHAGLGGQDLPKALPDDEAVIREDQPGHAAKVSPAGAMVCRFW